MPIETIPAESALVLVDLQPMITALPAAPHAAEAVLANAVRLAAAFRERGRPVVLLRVAFSPGGADAVQVPTDVAVPPLQLTEEAMAIRAELGPEPGDLVITKRGWDGFFGTELDLQLRRRGVRSVVMGGIRTAIGVESTARTGFLHGYEQVFAEDAMADVDGALHARAVESILPRLGRVDSTDAILAAL
jgi:nicotinamidase-related amidase